MALRLWTQAVCCQLRTTPTRFARSVLGVCALEGTEHSTPQILRGPPFRLQEVWVASQGTRPSQATSPDSPNASACSALFHLTSHSVPAGAAVPGGWGGKARLWRTVRTTMLDPSHTERLPRGEADTVSFNFSPTPWFSTAVPILRRWRLRHRKIADSWSGAACETEEPEFVLLVPLVTLCPPFSPLLAASQDSAHRTFPRPCQGGRFDPKKPNFTNDQPTSRAPSVHRARLSLGSSLGPARAGL